MDRSATPNRDRAPGDRRSLQYLRRRSLHRLWWRSPSVALKALWSKRAHHRPEDRDSGKRV